MRLLFILTVVCEFFLSLFSPFFYDDVSDIKRGLVASAAAAAACRANIYDDDDDDEIDFIDNVSLSLLPFRVSVAGWNGTK